MGQGSQIKRAIVLLNLGGPRSMDEVEPFLFSLFYDPAIITLPNPFRWILAKFISKRRLKEASHIYASLGGKSPLYEETCRQADALFSLTDENTEVFIAMRHAFPRTEKTFAEVRAWHPDEVVLLPLYPQYSTTTTGSAFQVWKDLQDQHKWYPKTRFVCCYPTLESFIKPIADAIQAVWKEASKEGPPKLILSAHGLPEKVIKGGDPYQAQVEATAQAILDHLKILGLDATVSYQSRVGPLPWIRPYTEDILLEAAQAERPIVMVPIAFVSEHSETLFELDQVYGTLAHENGSPGYYRIPTVSTNPTFIKGLLQLAEGCDTGEICPIALRKCGKKCFKIS